MELAGFRVLWAVFQNPKVSKRRFIKHLARGKERNLLCLFSSTLVALYPLVRSTPMNDRNSLRESKHFSFKADDETTRMRHDKTRIPESKTNGKQRHKRGREQASTFLVTFYERKWEFMTFLRQIDNGNAVGQQVRHSRDWAITFRGLYERLFSLHSPSHARTHAFSWKL